MKDFERKKASIYSQNAGKSKGGYTETFVLKGNIIYSRSAKELVYTEQGCLVCVKGISQGVFPELPERYSQMEIRDFGESIIIPGLSDLHVHGPQYVMRANGMDMELLDWLNAYTFPVESRFGDMDYARAAYGQFVEALRTSATTRACIFGTVHSGATLLLMELLEQAGLRGYVGKVNMDRNCPDGLREESAEQSLMDTEGFLAACRDFRRLAPILTPRFIPSCSDELMRGLAELQRKTGVPVQSHLSENHGEIAWVKELCPWSEDYGDAYDRLGLFGSNGKAVMAHCVHSTERELALMKERGVFVTHCPQSNTNLASGAAPVRSFLEKGIPTGLGSDVAGGYSLSILRAMADAIQVSKLRWRLLEEGLLPLTLEEAFYLGTEGGGAFFGKVGSFLPGYEFDAIVIDDYRLLPPHMLQLRERLERVVYLSDERDIVWKYVAGDRIL